jgi:group I intron endonuclease
MKKIGIYKITSPSGKVYIGQSIDIEKRKFIYSKLHCKTQTQLYNSLNKHGWENHIFETIELCDESKLLEREIFWKQYHLFLVDNNMAKVLFHQINDGKGGNRSDEIKKKIGISNTKPKPKGFGDKMSKIHKGRKRNDQTKINMSEAHKGFKHSKETKQNMSKTHKGRIIIWNTNPKKPIIQYDLEDNFIKEWESATEAAKSLNKPSSALSECCSGKRKKAYNYIWRFKE